MLWVMKQITTEIRINAPASRVWAVLTNFPRYPQWNPFITRIEGQPQIGTRLSITIQPPEANSMTFRPVVLRADSERELRWLGRLLLPKVFDGEHSFIIESVGEGAVLFKQSELFGGLLVPLLWGKIGNKTQRGFEMMNEALKKVSEAR